jgi:hypothetical protein
MDEKSYCEQEKKKLYDQADKIMVGMAGSLRTPIDELSKYSPESEPAQEMFMNRLRQRIRRQERKNADLDKLRELEFLLDKNPEVARIFDLFDAVGREV